MVIEHEKTSLQFAVWKQDYVVLHTMKNLPGDLELAQKYVQKTFTGLAWHLNPEFP